MNPSRWRTALWAAALLTAVVTSNAQQRPLTPHLGYVFPAGAQQGSTVEVTVGGQALVSPSSALITGTGVHVTVGQYSRPLNPREVLLLRDKLDAALKKLSEDPNAPVVRGGLQNPMVLLRAAREAQISDAELRALNEYRRRTQDPKRQLNPQLDEKVTLTIRVDPDAAPGDRELRLVTLAGLSNPVTFQVGRTPECVESEPNDRLADTCVPDRLPVVINGQITPGDVDRFAFRARKGERIVAAVAARQLIPYLADAVPGWFQPVIAVYDARGRELAYADHFFFRVDPVVACDIPEDGQYVLEIRDSIYRGREDFVYRITLGPAPYVTHVFPLGGRAGARTAVALSGWNLAERSMVVDAGGMEPGIHFVTTPSGARVPFSVDGIPDTMEKEPNDRGSQAQSVKPPVIVNGRIDHPGDVDVFRFQGAAGQPIVVEVMARRLGSPLDSAIELIDAGGKVLASNDDFEDKGAGLLTHQADSRILATLPRSGTYFVRLVDVQRHGGPEYAYRLRISPPQPDFDLRVVPSSLTARSGTNVPVTVYALRKDGFAGDIDLALVGAPFGYALGGAKVPAGQDLVRLTLAVPPRAQPEPVELRLVGSARIGGSEVRRMAQPAEDMMQAFAYRHLVPSSQWLVGVIGRGVNAPAIRALSASAVQIPAGGTARLRLAGPAWLVVDQLRFSLDEPPDGVELESVTPERGGVSLVLRADGKKVKPGMKGNLIVDAFREMSVTPANAKRPTTRRIPLGTVPAIPFEIVPAQTAADGRS